MSNNWTVTDAALEKLPLFATDRELAVAIVGPKRATEWLRASFPKLSALRGFPPVDAFHGGRPVIKVAAFYEQYIGATGPGVNAAPDGVDKVGTWNDRNAEKKARAKANADAWAEKKRKALEEFRARKGVDAAATKPTDAPREEE